MTDSLGTTRYTYDALYRLTNVVDPYSQPITYTYDVVGNRTRLAYPDGKVVTYTFDAVNRLITVTNWSNLATAYAYDKAHRLITTTLPNAINTVNAYDDANRLTQLAHMRGASLLSRYEFKVDGVGNRTAVTETLLQPGGAPPADVVFADGFESGDFSAWSAAVTDGGDLSVSTTAALVGTYGMQAVIDDTTAIYVRDDTPAAEASYRARFSFDPNSVTLPAGEDHDILAGRTGSGIAFRVQLAFIGGAYRIVGKIRNDAGSDTETTAFPITDAPHVIEVHWQAASAPGANDGALSLWLDGERRQSLSGIDNDTLRIEQARLGPSGSLNAGTSGTEFFDAFEWGRQVSLGDVLFADGFESGNLLAWSQAVADGGDLSATTAAALVGTYGMQAVVDDTTAIYVDDDTPTAEPRYRARFYFDPNSVTLPSGEDHDIFAGRTSGSVAFRVQVALVSGAYQVRAKIRNDAGDDASSADYAISDASHFVEVDWAAASGPGANDGYLSLWLDGELKQSVSGVDNDTLRIEKARLGPSGSLNAGTSGTEYFDAFESREQTYIGPVGSGGSGSLVTTTIAYSYDPLYRLTGANYSGAYTYTFAYRYDAVGNRTVQTRTITSTLVTTYSYDAANRLVNAGGVPYTWNANGNLLNDGSATYGYDFENRLISTTLGGTTTQFAYNGYGIRLRLIEVGTLTTYTQDYAAPLPVVLQAKTGSASTQYVYSLGTRPLAEYESAAWEYLLADPLGSVRQIANADGNVTLLKSYEPYGSVLNGQGTATSVFAYAGKQMDAYIKLVFLRARHYASEQGRFLSADPWCTAGASRVPRKPAKSLPATNQNAFPACAAQRARFRQYAQ